MDNEVTIHRIEYIDLLKTFTILCVIIGHVIPEMNNPIKTFVYSFHMSLFFVISGFFFKSSLNITCRELIVKKSKQLLLPYIIWTSVYFFLHHQKFDSISNVISIIRNLWFLPALFVIYFISFFAFKKLKNIYFALIFFILYIVMGCPWGQSVPAFLIGILLNSKYKSFNKYQNKLLILSSILFLICLVLWKTEYYYYNFELISLDNLEWQIPNILGIFHMAIGIIGSLFFFSLFKIIYRKNRVCLLFSNYGKYTLGIYVLHFLIIYCLNKIILKDADNVNIWIYYLASTLFVYFICIVMIKLIHKNKYIKLIL